MQHSDIFNGEEAECEVQDAPSANHLGKGIEFDLIYGRKLCSPILGYNCQLPDLPTSCIPPTTLDTSLLHIPIYAHLKIHDLKPVRLPEPPSILSSLQLQFSEGTILSKSSREISLTARLSEEDGISALCSAQNSTKITNAKQRIEIKREWIKMDSDFQKYAFTNVKMNPFQS